EPKEAAVVCGQAAATLTGAMSKATDPYALKALAGGLRAVAARLEPEEAAVVCGQAAAALTRAMSKTADASALRSLAEGLSAAVRREPSPLPAQTLVDLLKQPCCVGEARRV